MEVNYETPDYLFLNVEFPLDYGTLLIVSFPGFHIILYTSVFTKEMETKCEDPLNRIPLD